MRKANIMTLHDLGLPLFPASLQWSLPHPLVTRFSRTSFFPDPPRISHTSGKLNYKVLPPKSFTEQTLSCHSGFRWNDTSSEKPSLTSPHTHPGNIITSTPCTLPITDVLSHYSVLHSSEDQHYAKLFCVLICLASALALALTSSINLTKLLNTLSFVCEYPKIASH